MNKPVNGGVPWTCGRGHVLGLVVRGYVDGRWRSRLLMFRHAVSDEQLVVEIAAVLDGTARDIVCDACPPNERFTRTWWEDVSGKMCQVSGKERV